MAAKNAKDSKNEKKLSEIIEFMQELENDSTVPRNVKAKIANARQALLEQGELSLRIHKALNELDEIADDTNIQPYTRTQLWNIASLLESIL
ncbi:MAG: UPF0147 family protein [Candidatus Woesearchaeota archaeon]